LYVCVTSYGVQISLQFLVSYHILNFLDSITVIMHTHCFNGHFPSTVGLAASQCPVIHIVKHPNGQAKTLHGVLFEVGSVRLPTVNFRLHPTHIHCYLKVEIVFYRMNDLHQNRQHQSSEGTKKCYLSHKYEQDMSLTEGTFFTAVYA